MGFTTFIGGGTPRPPLVYFANVGWISDVTWIVGRARSAYNLASPLTFVSCPRLELPRPAPRQAPQSARREDGGEEPEHANREQRPDEKEVSAGIGEPAGDADALPSHVDVGDDQ